MNSTTFMNGLRGSCGGVLDSIDAAKKAIGQYTDDPTVVDTFFAQPNAVAADDPIDKPKVLTAGAALIDLIAYIGEGPGSIRAKLNAIRQG